MICLGDLGIFDAVHPVYHIKKKNGKELDKIDRIYRIEVDHSKADCCVLRFYTFKC
jgi:hypothetical protein